MSEPLILGTASWTDKPLIDSGRFTVAAGMVETRHGEDAA